jgi:hypothetical protein
MARFLGACVALLLFSQFTSGGRVGDDPTKVSEAWHEVLHR